MKLFIGGVPFSSSDSTLLAHISKVAVPETFKVVRDYNTGKSKGFAFATFKNPEDAQKVIKELDQVEFEGRRLGIKESIERPRTERKV